VREGCKHRTSNAELATPNAELGRRGAKAVDYSLITIPLTAANHAIYIDRSFNLVDYLQSQDRIHRISQERPAYIHNLVGKDTIDVYIDDVVSRERAVAASWMRLLLDENLDRLSRDLPGHQTESVSSLGWTGIQNGELLAKAAEPDWRSFEEKRRIRRLLSAPSPFGEKVLDALDWSKADREQRHLRAIGASTD
jgi:hypothetical protein